MFSEPVGHHSTVSEQGDPLVFLNATPLTFVSGCAVMVDCGFVGGVVTGLIDVQKKMAEAFA
jgi:hypothetical protein